MDHPPVRLWAGSFWQITRFGLVGLGNTLIDIASLNMLLWCFPTHDANLLLLYNALAYSLGAVNSFLLNKYWTFRTGRVIAGREMLRFVVVMIGSFLCNESLLWIAGTMLHALIPNPWLWANLSKVSAAIGTTSISYLAMRCWVFATAAQKARQAPGDLGGSPSFRTTNQRDEDRASKKEEGFRTCDNPSVILPAHYETAAIAKTRASYGVCSEMHVAHNVTLDHP